MKIEIFTHQTKEYTISLGKNKEENWQLIDAASPADIWFHIEDHPSCHIILKNTEKIKMRDIPKQVIKRCAYLCKINSAAKTMAKCNVIYAPISEVKKTEIVGQVKVGISKLVST
jgi:predicted ribosome quality control (RQC) complex YloA/Tae2 family protein